MLAKALYSDGDDWQSTGQRLIDRVATERQKLEAAQPAAKEGAKIVAMLPNAAQLYREQIQLGLSGDPRAALKARLIVRKLLKDEVLIGQDDDGSVWATR